MRGFAGICPALTSVERELAGLPFPPSAQEIRMPDDRPWGYRTPDPLLGVLCQLGVRTSPVPGRFEAARDDRPGNAFGECRGWNVTAVRPTGETTEVYCAVVEGTHSFALADNILVRNCHHNYTEQMSGDLMRYWKSRP